MYPNILPRGKKGGEKFFTLIISRDPEIANVHLEVGIADPYQSIKPNQSQFVLNEGGST